RHRVRRAAASNRRDGSALHTAWPRSNASLASEFLPLLDPVGALRVDDGNEPNDAAVAALPIPREQRKRAAPSTYLVDVAADVFDAQNAVYQPAAVYRLPMLDSLLPLATPQAALVILCKMRIQPTVALWPDGVGKRMIIRWRIVPDSLRLFLDEPLPR